jgi:hypothetical protein
MRRRRLCGREERVGEGVRGRVGEGVIERVPLPLSHSPTLPLCCFQDGHSLSPIDRSKPAIGITPN